MSDGTNLQAFQTALAHCAGLGAGWQPTNPLLDLGDMNTAYAAGHGSVDDFIAQLIPWKVKVNEREATFEGTGKLATRVQAFVASCGASDQNIDDMKGFVRLIHGGRAKKLKIDDPNTPVDESAHNSVSQRGYSDVVEHWNKIIALCNNLGGFYKPNENELKIATLDVMVAGMADKNQDVINAEVPKDNARDTKNVALYDGPTSLFERLRLIKGYLKAAFGATSNEYKQVSGLEIKKPGK